MNNPGQSRSERQAALEQTIQNAPPIPPSSDRCDRCGKRKGVVQWGDMLAYTHGFMAMRCRRCVYGPQLWHALGRAVMVPVLTAQWLWAVARNV